MQEHGANSTDLSAVWVEEIPCVAYRALGNTICRMYGVQAKLDVVHIV